MTLVKLLWRMSREMTKNSRGWGKPFLRAPLCSQWGFTLPKHSSRLIPFGDGTSGLIGWCPQPILVPGVLRSWETSVFSHHIVPLGILTALLPIKSFWEDPHPWEPFFSPNHAAFRHPFLYIIFCRMLVRGKYFPSCFLIWISVPATCNSLPYLFPLCMHPCIVNIFNFVTDCELHNPKNCE